MAKKRHSVKRVKRRGTKRRHAKSVSSTKKKAMFRQIILRLRKMKSSQRTKVLRMVNNKFIHDLCQHTRKLRHAKLTPATRKTLSRYRKQLRKLINKKSSLKTKRKLLSQRGSFIGPLLGALIPTLIGSIASKIMR